MNSSIDEEIDFLERICEIENHFKVELKIAGPIYESQYALVYYLSTLLRDDKVTSTCSEVHFTFGIDEKSRDKIQHMDEQGCSLPHIESTTVELFDTVFDTRFSRTYRCAVLKDLEKHN